MSNIIKGSGIIYTTGIPNTIPNVGSDAEFAVDINGVQYAWNRTTTVWDNIGQGIEMLSSSNIPTHTPSNFRPRFAITPSSELYYHSGSWRKVNPIGKTGIYSASGAINGTRLVNNGGLFGIAFGDTSNSIHGVQMGIAFGGSDITIGSAMASSPRILTSHNEDYLELDAPYLGNLKFDTGNSFSTFYTDYRSPGGQKGIEYADDYSSDIKLNDRSIPDVGTIKTTLTASYANNGVKYKTTAFTITQSGSNNPVISTIYQNDFNDTLTTTRDDTGNYRISSNLSKFTLGTFVQFKQLFSISNGGQLIINGFRESDEDIRFYVYNLSEEQVDLDTDYPLYIEIQTWV